MQREDESKHDPPFSHGLYLSKQRNPSQICINNKKDKIIRGIFPSISVEKFPAFQVGLLVEIHPLLSSLKNKGSKVDGESLIKSAGQRGVLRSRSRIILRSSATAAVILR